jgi:hypothetical protein
MSNKLDFVKSQLDFHRRQAIRFSDTPRRGELHAKTAADFEGLADYINNLEKRASQAPLETTTSQPRLALNWDEVKDLPEELLAELSISDGDKTEFVIATIINENGGIASLDRIIVELFKRTNEIVKRQAMTNRLYRMGQKEMVYSVPGKKGVYSTRPMTEEEGAKYS